jgi:hypothetical protein
LEASEDQIRENRNYDSVNRLIKIGAFDIDSGIHRKYWTHLNEWAHSATFRVANAICKTTPIFKIDDEEVLKISEFWEKQSGQTFLEKCICEDRTHGGLLVCKNKFKRRLPWRLNIKEWVIYSRAEIFNMFADSDEYPTFFEVRYDLTELRRGQGIRNFDATNSFWWSSELTDDNLGISVLSRIFDDLVDYMLIHEAVKTFALRWGHGFLTVKSINGMNEDQFDALQDQIKRMRRDRAIIFDGADEKDTFEWFNPSTPYDFVKQMDKIEERLSQGIEMPLRWLKGSEAGALSSASEDGDQIGIRLSEIFKKYIPLIKSFLLFNNIISEEECEKLVIELPEVAQTEKERLELEGLKIDNLIKSTWLTPNERRIEMGLEPIEGGDELDSMKIFNMQNEDNPDSENSDTNDTENDETGTQTDEEKSDAMTEYIKSNTPQKIADKLGISYGKAYQIKQSFITNERDYIEIKEAIVSLSDIKEDSQVIHATGYLITSDELEYEGRKEKRTIEEIQKWYDDLSVKEFYIGCNSDDSHNGKVRGEVLKEESIGKVIATGIDSRGVIGDIIIDLEKARERLGESYWLDDYIKETRRIPISATTRVTERFKKNEVFHTKLDVRSFVCTKIPRNPNTFANVK